MDKTKTIAILLGCIVITVAIAPSINSGEISESISKFVRAFAAFFSAILFGMTGTGGGDGQ